MLLCAALHAENWPQWRGPAFNGTSPETGLPSSFSKTDNIAWTVPLSGSSAATPIVWEDSVFVCTHDKRTQDLQAICVNRKDGTIRWTKKVAIGASKASQTGKNTHASPSPVTDGKTVWFTFGSGDIVAYDFSGTELWAKSLVKEYGALTYMHGFSSSPLLYEGKLYIPLLRREHAVDTAGARADKAYESFFICLDGATGKEIWKQTRVGGAKDGGKEGYTTPIPFNNNGKTELVLTGADALTSHDPSTGSEIWRWLGFVNPGDSRTCCSAVIGDGLIYVGASQRNPTLAIKPGGSGLLPAENKVWSYAEFPANVGSPLLYQGSLYLIDVKKKMLSCLDPKTGARKWVGSLGVTAEFTASPTAADGKIYCMSEASDVIVVSPGPEFKILNTVHFEDAGVANASISFAHKQIFIRTGEKLYCVGK